MQARKREPFFVGSFDVTVDPKNRLSVPASAREELGQVSRDWADEPQPAREEGGVESLYILPGDRKEILAVYEASYFRAIWLGLPPTQQLSRHVRDWIRLQAGLAAKVQPDNQGRVVIPDRLMKLSNLTRDVTLVGAQDHYEIWSRSAYLAFQESKFANYDEGYEQTLEELAQYRKSASVTQ